MSTIDVAHSPKGKVFRQTSLSSSLNIHRLSISFGLLDIAVGCDDETRTSSVLCMAKAKTSLVGARTSILECRPRIVVT